MSGIIFNGVEMKNGEDKSEYIKRIFDKMNIPTTKGEINYIIENDKKGDAEEYKKDAVKRLIDDDLSETDDTISDCSSSDDDPLSDSDSELDTEQLEKLGLTYFKRVLLGTYDCSMEEHDDLIKWFNDKYGTEEQGSNGSKGHYWTHGERPYNLFKMKKLKSLYDRKINKVSYMNIKVHITFIDPTNEDLKIIGEYTNILNNYKSQLKHDRHIELKDCIKFNHLIEYNVVDDKRDYNHSKSTINHKWKLGDVVFNYVNPFLKFITFWQVVKITNKMMKVKPLKPIMTIKHINENSPNKVYIIKYKKDVFMDDVKSKYVNKRTQNTVYIIDDYILRLFKEQHD